MAVGQFAEVDVYGVTNAVIAMIGKAKQTLAKKERGE